MAGLLSSAFGFNESEGAVTFAWFHLVSPSSSARLSFCAGTHPLIHEKILLMGLVLMLKLFRKSIFLSVCHPEHSKQLRLLFFMGQLRNLARSRAE